MPVRKSKLTLTVDAGTVEKAKHLGINISELTEKVLRGWVFDPHDESRVALMDHYQAMFDTMTPLLKEYDVPVHVANYYITYEDTLGPSKPHLETATEEIFLQPGGHFWFPDGEVLLPFEKLREDTEIYFLNPEQILQNFIEALEKGKAKRHERLESLEVARRLIEAIAKIEAEPGAKKALRPLKTTSTKGRKHARRR
ncbi:MAG TPA: type II toxin-antitoxin system CcdA family antitoxin [Thermoplasmata archaeon]|nr:type II toxin-antitoxin system CcdA family antitoxin [Thermoplasmata archaeon]